MTLEFEKLEIIDDDGSYHVPDLEVCKVAQELKNLWEPVTGLYFRFRIPAGPKSNILFYRAAELIIANKMTPAEYLRILVEGMARTGIISIKALQIPKVYAEGSGIIKYAASRWIANYKAQAELFEVRYRLYGPIPLLADDTVEFTPLFRCVMAYVCGDLALSMKFKNDAKMELEMVPIARDVFNDQLPEFLR